GPQGRYDRLIQGDAKVEGEVSETVTLCFVSAGWKTGEIASREKGKRVGERERGEKEGRSVGEEVSHVTDLDMREAF
ncbi:hypothetical protein KUCAC02_004396, partial [Chaenocephalus aceratus]